MQEIRLLNDKELEMVNGGVVANVAGAVVGGVTGFYTTLIIGENSATASDLAWGAAVGAAAGFFNPISSGASFAGAVAGGAGSGSLLWFKGVLEKSAE
ncbi:TPA: class IIb bacteriocin, lactobin A/cerein 7B family [Vibrio vulnificus]